MKLRQKSSTLVFVMLTTLAIPATWAHGNAYDEDWSSDYRNHGPMPGSFPWMAPGMMQQDWIYIQPGYPFTASHHHQGAFHGLDLNREQHQQITKIFREFRNKMHRIHDEMIDKRQALSELLDESYDKKAVQKLANQMATLMAERIVIRSETHAQIKALLTPEQQQQFHQRMLHRF